MMRRAKMMLKPKLGPSVKQNQPQQVQPQTPKTIEHDAQVETPPEEVSMPPPPLEEQCAQEQSPKHVEPKTASAVDNVVQSATSEEEIVEQIAPSKEMVLSNQSNKKAIVGRPRAAKVNVEPESAAPLPARRERKPTKKADEFREMLMASRRRFGKVREPIDTSKLTMLDLIYYNPPGAPMRRKAVEAEKLVEKLEQQSLEPELEEESNTADSTRGTAEDEVMGPRVVVGPDGEIQIDETSLVIRRPNPLESKHKLKVTVEEAGKARYNSFKTRKMKKCTWTTKETSKFYQALSICGTDFTLMTQFFPTRSRQDLKNKFKREEKSNAALIDKAIHHPTQFEYTDFELEDIAKDDTEPQRTKSPRSGSKGKRKRKPKAMESVDKEVSMVADRPANEELVSLGVSRPKRNRARVDYAGLHESANDHEDAISLVEEREERGVDDGSTGGIVVELRTNVAEATGDQPSSARRVSCLQSESSARSGTETSGSCDVPPEAPGELSEIAEQSPQREQPIANTEPCGERTEAPAMGKPSQTVPALPSRKIRPPVFKPRHRKAEIGSDGFKCNSGKKSLRSADLPAATLLGATNSSQRSSTVGVEEEKRSDAASGTGNSKMDTVSGSDAADKESNSDEVDVDKLPTITAHPDASDQVSGPGASSSPPARHRTISGPSEPAQDPFSSKVPTAASEPDKALTESHEEAESGTRIEDSLANEIQRFEGNSTATKSTTLPKLVLPSRPITNRIIRPIGAAKTRGTVLSPVTKRRSESSQQDQ